ALLVDRDEDVRALGTKRRRQRSDLLAALDVACVEEDPAEALGEPPAHPVRRLDALEAGEEAAKHCLARLAHPLTAPDVSPKRIRLCRRRKKATAGSAVSVEAAINAPQSVFRLVP